MKPDWQDAPEWANYLAKDSDGRWYWYEEEPILNEAEWVNVSGSNIRRIEDNTPWGISLEKRPDI